MQTRQLGQFTVSALGLGCMSMSQAYGTPDRAESERVLHRALDIGYTFLDTASVYGVGHNETLIGEVLKQRRHEFVLASKCGIYRTQDQGLAVDCRPESIRATCEDSLRRLQTDVIDLYYLHRVDPKVPLEDQIGTMADLVTQGKIQAIGLSEVGPNTLRKAHQQYPVTALQSEYSLCSREVEQDILPLCKELGVAFVPFSPLSRALLTDNIQSISEFDEDDFRHSLPRFQGENLAHNKLAISAIAQIAKDNHCTLAQLALAWLLAQGDGDYIPIPGTKHVRYVNENAGAVELEIATADLVRCGELINDAKLAGERYNPQRMRSVNRD